MVVRRRQRQRRRNSQHKAAVSPHTHHKASPSAAAASTSASSHQRTPPSSARSNLPPLASPSGRARTVPRSPTFKASAASASAAAAASTATSPSATASVPAPALTRLRHARAPSHMSRTNSYPWHSTVLASSPFGVDSKSPRRAVVPVRSTSQVSATPASSRPAARPKQPAGAPPKPRAGLQAPAPQYPIRTQSSPSTFPVSGSSAGSAVKLEPITTQQQPSGH